MGDTGLERMVETRGRSGQGAKSELERQRVWDRVQAVAEKHSPWAEKLAREDNEDTPNTGICPRLGGWI